MKKVMLFIIMLIFFACNDSILPVVIIPPVQKYAVTVTHNDGGTVDPNFINIDAGNSITVSVTPYTNYSILSVTIDGVNQSITSSYVFKNVKKDINIDVRFANNNFLILSKGADDKSRPWHLKNISYYDHLNNFLDSLILVQTPERLTDKKYFSTDGRYYTYHADGTSTGSVPFRIEGDKYIVDNKAINTIVVLNDTVFTYNQPEFLDILPGILTHGRLKYVRLPKK